MTGREADSVDYATLAELRYAIRKFLAFSEKAAAAEGLTAQQHQALLTIKGIGSVEGLTVGVLAERLLVCKHTAVELVDRLERAGLVLRTVDPADRRRVPVQLTAEGERRLAALTGQHLAEWHLLGPALATALRALKPGS